MWQSHRWHGRRDLGLSRLRLGLIAGGTATPDMIRWFMALGIDPIEVYGPAESSGLAAAPAARCHPSRR
jgi:long-subunit acyl-CoA synthetase (AMP-forming)